HQQHGGPADESAVPHPLRPSRASRPPIHQRTAATRPLPAVELLPLRTTSRKTTSIPQSRPSLEPKTISRQLARKPLDLRLTRRIQKPDIESGRVRKVEPEANASVLPATDPRW